MFFAPISEVVTIAISKSNQKFPPPQLPNKASQLPNKSVRPLLLLILLVLLSLRATPASAQEPSPQFQDLAARAAAARDQDNLPLAIQLYTQAEQLKSDWAEGWFYLGLLQYRSNAFPAAIDAFNHFLQLQPGAPPALALRGLCEFETSAYDDSLRDLAEAVAKGAANEPHNEQIIRYHLAQLLARAGRFQDAVTQYQFFASRQIDDPDLLVGLGSAGMRSTLLTKDVPAQDRPLYQSAGAAGYTFLSGYSPEADALFNQLFARYPTTPNLHFFYGFLLFPHAPELAVEQFRAEMTVAPGNVPGRAILAYTLMIAGRYADALTEAETALAAAPDMEMVQLALGRSLAEIGDTNRATDVLNHVLQLDPDSLEAHMGLAVVYARTGRREDAYRERMVCHGLSK
jgi:tetratricopeptide (TPR) repeat protein